MVELRKAVLVADEAEDDAKIDETLRALQEFTLKHIVFNIVEENGEQKIVFGTGPFYLEHQYLRQANVAIAKAKELAAQNVNTSENVYDKAAEVCDALGRQRGWSYDANYIGCMQSELAKYPASDKIAETPVDIPSTELFRHDFASPLWYPCLSGIVILVTALLSVMLVVRILVWLGLHFMVWVIEHF